jgi:hypothetical protein
LSNVIVHGGDRPSAWIIAGPKVQHRFGSDKVAPVRIVAGQVFVQAAVRKDDADPPTIAHLRRDFVLPHAVEPGPSKKNSSDLKMVSLLQ